MFGANFKNQGLQTSKAGKKVNFGNVDSNDDQNGPEEDDDDHPTELDFNNVIGKNDADHSDHQTHYGEHLNFHGKEDGSEFDHQTHNGEHLNFHGKEDGSDFDH